MENINTTKMWSLEITVYGKLADYEGKRIVIYYPNDKEVYEAREKHMNTLKTALRFNNGITEIEDFVFNNSELNAFRIKVLPPLKPD